MLGAPGHRLGVALSRFGGTQKIEMSVDKGARMSQQDQYNRAVAALNAAAFDDARWPEAAARMDEACGANANIVVIGDEGAAGRIDISLARFCFRGRYSDYWERRYFERLYHSDERIPRLRQLMDGQLVHVPSLYTADERKRSEAYREQARAEVENGLNMRLTLPDGGKITWQVGNPVDRDGWGSGQLRVVEALRPHLLHFAQVRRALAQADAFGRSMEAILEAQGVGVVQLDRRRRIVAASNAALAHLRNGHSLGDNKDGTLEAASKADDKALQGLLAGALARPGAGGSMRLRNPYGPPLVLHVAPIAESDSDCEAGRTAALALVVDTELKAPDPGPLARVLGLTAAEAEVAALLAGGLTPKQAGVGSGRVEGTIRWHLHNIFAKLGIERQAELVRLVQACGWLPGGDRGG